MVDESADLVPVRMMLANPPAHALPDAAEWVEVLDALRTRSPNGAP
jgi:hypothetical protein